MYLTGYNYQDFDYVELKKTPSTVIATNATGGLLNVVFPNGSDDIFLQNHFEFHSPSEHTVNRKNYDLEL